MRNAPLKVSNYLLMSVNVGLLFHPFYNAPCLNWTAGVITIIYSAYRNTDVYVLGTIHTVGCWNCAQDLINPHVSSRSLRSLCTGSHSAVSLIAAARAAHNKRSAAGLNTRSSLSAHANPSAMWILMFHFSDMFILLKPCLCVTKSDFCVQGSIFISFFFFFFKDNPVTKSKCCHCTYLSDSYQVNIPTISNILCTDKCLWIEFWMRSLPFSNGNLNHLRDVFQTSLLFSCDVGTHSNQAYGEKKQA